MRRLWHLRVQTAWSVQFNWTDRSTVRPTINLYIYIYSSSEIRRIIVIRIRVHHVRDEQRARWIVRKLFPTTLDAPRVNPRFKRKRKETNVRRCMHVHFRPLLINCVSRVAGRNCNRSAGFRGFVSRREDLEDLQDGPQTTRATHFVVSRGRAWARVGERARARKNNPLSPIPFRSLRFISGVLLAV